MSVGRTRASKKDEELRKRKEDEQKKQAKTGPRVRRSVTASSALRRTHDAIHQLLSGPGWTALVLHVERCGLCRRLLVRLPPQRCDERLNSLATVQFTLAVLLVSGPIAIPF